MISTILKSLIVATVFFEGNCNQLKKIQMSHQSTQLSENAMRYLSKLSNVKYTNEVLDNILIPRVVGTSGHKKVFEYIKKELKNLDWNVEVDEFEDDTPKGRLIFKNIIATLNPNADRYLVLSCHYDSKYFEDIVFVGAIDSAVPCAMMLNLIKVMDKELKSVQSNSLSLKLIFFDGEEAFVEWGPKDSIYGARHLAQVYQNKIETSRASGERINENQKIDMLILLDLIGHKATRFLSTSRETENWYLRLANIETRLGNLSLLEGSQTHFVKRRQYGGVEDDHIPFLQRNVPILHLISIPFGSIWHTEYDNRDAIEMSVVENINKVLRIFVAEYLNIYSRENNSAQTPVKSRFISTLLLSSVVIALINCI
ncbi:glutaminyl-peptide cyclotransferase isoform X1 [Diabrotica virgifera virgifera]|uniref:Glutaminyl-peptide cyclotransferase n=1 Tax=Diabrotica virgifera virgifera TaxID=50390 RepID=A0A6P7FAQ3_DIAVI|nr:glutaminyl-peptide cyclotransferase isoform X1 [Diabrotica virgifera virgifera]XP_028131873.1 glutaminyl-peptide cyclotransferase isoform X1 [Diabrotica virgifera virgifera]